MRQPQSTVALTLGRTVRKLFVSAFVIFMFLIYAVHERLAGPAQAANQLPDAPAASPTAPAPNRIAAIPTAVPPSQDAGPATQPPADSNTTGQPTAVPSDPTAVPASSTAAGQYKDGQYTGPQVDAFYGWVQVQAIIQRGQITDVKFLQYPSDRRTSQRINSIAMPYLTTEAIQAQSANVDIISGATLTSEAFAQSLQSALQSATP